MSWIDAGIGAGGSILGALIGGSFGQAADSKAFGRQKWMMSNSHQLEVGDLKAAGLNPMLSGMGGSGASASSVSNTAGQTASAGASAGASAARLATQEVDTLKAQADSARASAANSLAGADKAKAETDYTTRRTEVELGGSGSTESIMGGVSTGRQPVEGLRQQEVAANIELLKQRAAELGYSNVKAAAEAGVYKNFPSAVPINMLLDIIGKGTGIVTKAIK